MRENNITLSYKNIILFLNNLIDHLTDNKKIITSSFIILTLSLFNITLYLPNGSSNSVSALSYETKTGVSFTFNPSLSLSISSSNLVIDNLTPGTTADSNDITISVSTNASYGYTLFANTSSENLTRSDNVNAIFSNIANNADLESLTTDNTWGYSASLDDGINWSNYNGLSSSTNATLLDKDNNISSSLDFRIAAKAGSTQPNGIYTNTITFYATTKPTPMNLAESYFANGKSRYKGYYTMQDMNSTICEETEVIGEGSQTQLIDIRDDKVYWATKLADGHCWMTQNLDLDLDSNRTYTHWDTDLGWSTEDNNVIDENANWQPMRSTINFNGANTAQVSGWAASYAEPYSANPGDIYYYTSGSSADDVKYDSLQDCASAGHNNCTHYHTGNYYNWNAAVASNNISELSTGDAVDSICPSGWKIATRSNNEFGDMLYSQDVIASPLSNSYSAKGFVLMRDAPIYFVRSGNIDYSVTALSTGWYWYSNVKKESVYFYAGHFEFNRSTLLLNDYYGTIRGFSVRCLAR